MSTSYTRPHPEALYFHIASASLARTQSTSDRWIRAQAVATTLVFSALCLEAYANQRLEDLGLGDFESLSLETKWRNLPRLAGSHAHFDEGRMPFQGFRELVKLRNNRLVHFHPDKEILRGFERGKGTYHADIFQDVGLAERAVATVIGMITEFRAMANIHEPAPDFLSGSKYTSYVVASRTVPIESLQSVTSEKRQHGGEHE